MIAPTTREEPNAPVPFIAGHDLPGPASAGARLGRQGPASATPAHGAADRTGGRPPQQRGGDLAQLLSLLADRTRMRILRILSAGERPVVALTAELRLPQPTVSHHLAWLKTLDLVTARRQGKHIYYALGPAVEAGEAGTLRFIAGDATVAVAPRGDAADLPGPR